MRNIYMIGIGGMGMAPLALYLQKGGYLISGYDDNISEPVRSLLLEHEVNVFSETELSDEIEGVVYSSAVARNHPCYEAACVRGVPLLKRGSMLARAVADKKLIAVVGSHGKTTTAGMLISALEKESFKFGYILGALFKNNSSMPARYDKNSEWVIAEIDESDGTINEFSPEITLTTNLDWDHPDQYPDPGELEDTFGRLFQRTKKAVFFPSCNNLFKQLPENNITCELIRFGEGGDYAGNILEADCQSILLKLEGRSDKHEVKVPAPGNFNAANALGALAVTHYLTAHLNINTLSSFPGIVRRQTILYNSPQLLIYEDYAHHPGEIAALIDFIRESYSGFRVIVVFQPHRYTRTLQYKEAFAQALKKADVIFLMDVYPANENPIEGGASIDLLKLLPEVSPPKILTDVDELDDSISSQLIDPSVLLFIGAGDISQWAEIYVSRKAKQTPEKVKRKKTSTRDEKWWENISQNFNSETRLSCFEPLADKTTIRVGGSTRYYAEPASENDLSLLIKEAKKNRVALFFIGRGSNLIVPDEGFQGLVIRLNHKYWKQIKSLGEGRLWVGAGVRLKRICGESVKLGMGGFEFLEGIPGTLGGSLRMNAGAMGGWMFDIVESVHRVTLDGTLEKLSREDIHVGYRECEELKEAIAIGAILRATSSAEAGAIREKVESFSSLRKESQPREPSAGCIFKNPKGGYAGQLIDELGLKGKQIGAAQVSNIHGNFIINKGGATSRDVISLIKEVRQEVKIHRGFELQPEVLLMGKNWSEVL